MSLLEKRLQRAREFLEEGDFFRILTHYDVDGVCSAGIIAGHLLEKGKRFHISFLRNADREEIRRIVEREERVILTDLGSSLVEELKGRVLIVDHHSPPGDSEEVVHVNPHLFGYDGAIEATATTMAYLIVDDRKYAKCFLSGLLGDKQYLPSKGPVGLNRQIMEKLEVKPVFDLPLFGDVEDAIFYSIEPFYVGLSGRRDEIAKALKRIGIEPTRDITSLSEEEKVRLGSYLALNLIRNSKIPDAGKYIVDLDFNLDGSVRYFTELIDSACRTENQGIAMSYILGKEENLDRMEVLRRDYRSQVIGEMYYVLENMVEMEHVQYFYAHSSYLGSTISTIGTLYLFDPLKITLSLYVDSNVSVSARAHRSLAERVNLGRIMRTCAEKLGGHGGGHNVAAGATIPRGTEEDFVKLVNEEIGKILSS